MPIFLLFLFLFSHPVHGLEPYQAIESLVSKDQIPRIFNTSDQKNLDSHNPQPHFSPTGDFNGDGKQDIAISGIYDLPKGSHAYFLLVATQESQSLKMKRLYFKEYDKPVFLFHPGSTGEGDPKDQAFSMSFCTSCHKGVDFYWNTKKNHFDIRKWKKTTKRVQKMVTIPTQDVSPEEVDKSLQMARERLLALIWEAGRIPAERDCLYNVIQEFDSKREMAFSYS